MLPSREYMSVVPAGMATFTVKEFVNNLLSVSITGSARRSEAKIAVALVASGVGVDVHPHSSPPSAVLAYEARLMASGYCWLATSCPLPSLLCRRSEPVSAPSPMQSVSSFFFPPYIGKFQAPYALFLTSSVYDTAAFIVNGFSPVLSHYT